LAAERSHRGFALLAALLAALLPASMALAASRPSAPARARLQPAALASPGEEEVEAAYLVNFLRYTQWPASSFESPSSPYVICVVGSERSYAAVRAVAAAAGALEGRAIEVRWVRAARGSRSAPFDSAEDHDARSQLRGSHLVFFHRSAGRVHPQVVADLASLPVLTVSDTDAFIAKGGMLGLVRLDRRIVFEANPGAIRNAGLVVSAKVLKLARPAPRAQP
jgi:hypothetical protein